MAALAGFIDYRSEVASPGKAAPILPAAPIEMFLASVENLKFLS